MEGLWYLWEWWLDPQGPATSADLEFNFQATDPIWYCWHLGMVCIKFWQLLFYVSLGVSEDSCYWFPFSDVIWFPSHSPKMSVCLLRAIHSKLLTRDFLKSINIPDIDICILCNASQETIQHLYFQCPYSSYIWSLCKLKLGLARYPIGTLQDET